jgi:transcriptional regulator with XRE-family HTH domain
MSIRARSGTVVCMVSNLGEYIEARRLELGIRTQLALAELADVPATTVNRIETGVTKLPSADIRRRLATALRVRHIDLLIAAGELLPEEISGAAVAPVTFPENSPAAKVIEILRHLPDEQALYVLGMARFAERRAHGESDEEEEPIVRVGTNRKVG